MCRPRVDQGDDRLLLNGELEGNPLIGGGSDDLNIHGILEQAHEGAADQAIAIGDKDANRFETENYSVFEFES